MQGKEIKMLLLQPQFLPLLILVFVFGLTIGSFLNVLIYRIPANISIARGRSFCPTCKHRIQNRDLIPVLSYILLGGRCRHCNQKISIRYPLVELSTGLLALLIVLIKGIFLEALIIFAIGAILISISLIDWDTMTIPDSLIVALIPLVIILIWLSGDWNIWNRVIGAFLVSLPMYLSLYLVKDSFGGGDIKLFFVLGFLLGWEKTLLTLFISSIVAAVIGVVAARSKNENIRGKHIPFGPYICTAAMISLLLGDQILSWYLGLYM